MQLDYNDGEINVVGKCLKPYDLHWRVRIETVFVLKRKTDVNQKVIWEGIQDGVKKIPTHKNHTPHPNVAITVTALAPFSNMV